MYWLIPAVHTCAPWYSSTFSADDYEALEARGAVESPGSHTLLPPLNKGAWHPGTPTVNHK